MIKNSNNFFNNKKYKVGKITKKYLYKTKTKTKTYNLYGGSRKLADIMFKEKFDIIKGQLLKEKSFLENIKTNTKFNNNLNLSNSNSPYKLTHASDLFTKIIIKKLHDITTKFNTETNSNINEKQFIDDNILWIITCYINMKFKLYEEDSPDLNLLFKNYELFLELHTKLKFLLDNRNIMYDAFKLKIKEKLDNEKIINEKLEEIKTIYSKKKGNFILNTFDSLYDLKKCIDKYEKEISEIVIAKINIELKATGKNEGNVEVLLDNPQVGLYKILTKAGSLCYGSDTTWCTATTSFFNKYDNYKESGFLYVIQDKKHKTHKYQMHIVSGQLRDDKDKPISISDVLKSFDYDEDLKQYFDELSLTFPTITLDNLYDFKYIEKNQKLIINIRSLYYDFIYKDLKKEDFIILLKEYLEKNKHKIVKELVFGNMFNQELEDSLNSMVDLESLTFGHDFNKPLGNSLDSLVNLKILTFGDSFNQELGNSLDSLIKLQSLNLGKNYNKTIPETLKHLIF
jgi:hypothetical protein